MYRGTMFDQFECGVLLNYNHEIPDESPNKKNWFIIICISVNIQGALPRFIIRDERKANNKSEHSSSPVPKLNCLLCLHLSLFIQTNSARASMRPLHINFHFRYSFGLIFPVDVSSKSPLCMTMPYPLRTCPPPMLLLSLPLSRYARGRWVPLGGSKISTEFIVMTADFETL